MAYEFILYEAVQGVAKITLNRPDVLNSFNRPMAVEVRQAFSTAAADAEVRAVLLTGAGRAFCSGQDLAEMTPKEGPTPDLGDIVARGYNPIVRTIRQIDKPVVCAVNGVAAGAGANIALACDVVVATQSASFIQAFCKIGLIPDSGGTYFLPRLAGTARAMGLALLGDRLSAADAAQWGLIWRCVEDAEFGATVEALVAQLAQAPTRGLGAIKRALHAAEGNSLAAQLDVERDLQRELGYSDDYREGVAAFLAKRPPRFTGR